MIYTIVIFLILLSVLVLAHEWGHFFTARKLGIKVEEFGLGFPPRAFSWVSQKTGIRWSLNWIPLGGFVKMRGENGEDLWDPDTFGSKPAWKRFLVLVAGVTMNMVLAAVLLSIALGSGVHAVVEQEDSGAVITNRAFEITSIIDGAPAQVAGLNTQDKIIAINDVTFESGDSLREFLISSDENSVLVFDIERDGIAQSINVVPSYVEELDRIGIGLAVYETGDVSYKWYLLPVKGIEMTWWYTREICVGLYTLIRDAIAGNGLSMEVSGPVGIAIMTKEAAQMGFVYLLQFSAILSINLAILNILPLPALDGGRVLFLIIEAITRKRVHAKIEAIVHNIGFLLLILLVLFITYKDVLGLVGT